MLTGMFESTQASLITVMEAFAWVVQGAGVTIAVVICALLFGLVLGVPMAVGQVYGPRPIRQLIGLYVWFFRGVPILILLYLFYFGLGFQLGLDISPFVASCLVLGLTSTAYQSQIFRGCLLALPQGQLKAAHALGMSTPTAIINIMLPQALRHSIAGWSNEYSILLKDSTLVSVVGTSDLMSRIKNIATSTAEFVPFFLTAAILYFLITFVGVRALRLLEKRVHVPGYTPM